LHVLKRLVEKENKNNPEYKHYIVDETGNIIYPKEKINGKATDHK
jgi:hypothetical protein